MSRILRRTLHLACPLVGRRVAGAGLDGEIKPHLPRGAFPDCAPPSTASASVERRDIEACGQPAARPGFGGRAPRPEVPQPCSAGILPASCPHRWGQRAARWLWHAPAQAVPADAHAAAQPRPANQSRKARRPEDRSDCCSRQGDIARLASGRGSCRAPLRQREKFPHAPRFRLAFEYDFVYGALRSWCFCAAKPFVCDPAGRHPGRGRNESVSGNPHCEGICQGRGKPARRGNVSLQKGKENPMSITPRAQARN